MKQKDTSAPFFTVVVPVFNKEPHISRSINSVLKQEFGNFELIVVDDGSSDGSLSEIQKFNDARIVVYKNSRPTGPSAARNKGIRNAQGKWVAFLDADDEWASTHLKKAYEGAKNFPQASIISCGYNVSTSPTSIKTDTYYTRNKNKGDHLYDVKTYISGPRPICTSVAIIKTDLLSLSGGFNEKLRHEEDQDLWLRLLLQKNIVALWRPFIGATYHTDSVNMVSKNRFQVYSPVVETIKAYVAQCPQENTNLCQLLKKYSNTRSKKLIKRKVLANRINMLYLNEILFWDCLNFRSRLVFSLLAICPHKAQKQLINQQKLFFSFLVRL